MLNVAASRMAAGPGLLYVTAQPQDTLHRVEFHDWYNNEHGPTRLRLPFVRNGSRYRARADARPHWLALYDVTDVAELTRPGYTRLREPKNKSPRETRVMDQVTIDRRIYELLYTKSAPNRQADETAETLVISAVAVAAPDEADLQAWTIDEHIPAVAQTPGWLRSRRFRTSPADGTHDPEYLLIHEYTAPNQVSVSSLGETKNLFARATATRGPFVWDLFYRLGPASRDLDVLWDASVAAFVAPNGKTRTIPVPAQPAIESYVTTSDGVELPYRLEGNGDANAPLLVLINPILVPWGVWDAFVAVFLADARHKHFRILRYNARGRSAAAGSQDVTLDLLSHDLLALLDALRVPVAIAMGVSLGGATALYTALHHPDRVPRFVACDTNDVAPASNPKAWEERVAIAEQEGAVREGKPIVGAELAEKTIRRWFVESSYQVAATEAEIQRVKAMVQTNSLPGFKTAVRALYAYDLQEAMRRATAEGIFVVGSGDGVLPQTMAAMAARYGGSGADLLVIDDAGHLPMVEQPVVLVERLSEFLCKPWPSGASSTIRC